MAASEKTLGKLHEVVAPAFMEQVVGYEEEDKEGNTRLVRPSPALIGAATAFIKNNNVTADAEAIEAMGLVPVVVIGTPADPRPFWTTSSTPCPLASGGAQ